MRLSTRGAARSRWAGPRRRRGSAAPRRRPGGRSRSRTRRPRRARRSRRAGGEGQRAEDAARTRSAPIISRRRESRSTSGPTRRPIATAGRKSAISSALDPRPEGAVLDVDRERDHRQPRPDARPERGEEEEPEARPRPRRSSWLAATGAADRLAHGNYRAGHERRAVQPGPSGGRPGEHARQRLARRACSSGVPTVTRIAPGAPKPAWAARSRPRGAAARTAAARPRPCRRRGSSRPPGPPVEAVPAEDPLELARGPRRSRAAAARARPARRGSRARPPARRRDVEGPPHLADPRDDVGRREAVADAEPGEPVDLRERPQDDDAPALLRVLSTPSG